MGMKGEIPSGGHPWIGKGPGLEEEFRPAEKDLTVKGGWRKSFKRRKPKGPRFNPGQTELDKAKAIYFKKGGKITILETEGASEDNFRDIERSVIYE